MSTNPFDLPRLRATLARRGIYPAVDLAELPARAQLPGLTPDAFGHDRLGAVLHRLRTTATGGEYALTVLRDPDTHDRIGYVVHARDQRTADQIAAAIRDVLL